MEAVEHVLTGGWVPLIVEGRDEVARRFEDREPAADVARSLARRAGVLPVRLDRCARREAVRSLPGRAGRHPEASRAMPSAPVRGSA